MQETDYHKIPAELLLASSQDDSLLQLRTLISANQYLRLYQLVTESIEPGSTMLDWGTGNGHFSYFLGRTGYTTSGFGFDNAPKICNIFSPEVYDFKRGDPDDPISLPYEDETFDAVVSVGVLEHVRETGGNESASLNEIHRILKPKGIFLCFHLPNQYSWIEAMLRLVGRWSHQYRYTSKSIESLANNAGFEVVKMQRYAILPRNIWWWGLTNEIADSEQAARLYDGVDNFLSKLLSPICQNYLFVAQKQI